MERVRDYELKHFFSYVIDVLESLGIPYMVVGGFAAILYGQPRLTIDVDIVVDMALSDLEPFVRAFPIPDYYASPEGIRDSLERRYPFNVIEPTTGAKVDLVPLRRDPFTRDAFDRRRRVVYDQEGRSAMFIAPEDIVVAKLVAYANTDSDRHLRDAQSVLAMQWDELDLDLMRRNARLTGVLEPLENLVDAVRPYVAGRAD